MEGDFDSGYSIYRLKPHEDPKSPPLFKQEAEQLAVKFFEEHRELPPNSQLSSHFMDGNWTISVFIGNPVYYPAFTFDARIEVDSARQILTSSVVGREIPRKGEWIDNSDVLTKVRLTVAGYFTENGYQHEASNITELLGRIDSWSDSSITGTFSSKSFAPDSLPQELLFPGGALKSVQKIF